MRMRRVNTSESKQSTKKCGVIECNPRMNMLLDPAGLSGKQQHVRSGDRVVQQQTQNTKQLLHTLTPHTYVSNENECMQCKHSPRHQATFKTSRASEATCKGKLPVTSLHAEGADGSIQKQQIVAFQHLSSTTIRGSQLLCATAVVSAAAAPAALDRAPHITAH